MRLTEELGMPDRSQFSLSIYLSLSLSLKTFLLNKSKFDQNLPKNLQKNFMNCSKTAKPPSSEVKITNSHEKQSFSIIPKNKSRVEAS